MWKKIQQEIKEFSFEEVTEAFAVAGYPPDEAIKGILCAYGAAEKVVGAVKKFYAGNEVDNAVSNIHLKDLL